MKDRPTCGKCGKVMSPEDSRIHPEYFLHDACLPEELAAPPASSDMSEKPTPGPWTWEYHPSRKGKPVALAAKGRDVILATGDEEASWLEVDAADALLVAAAPELLEACRTFAAWDEDPCVTEADATALRRVVAAAIAKAEGRTDRCE